MNIKFRNIVLISFLLVALGCSRGPILPDPNDVVQNRVVEASALSPTQINFWHQVKPVIQRRCAVCHSCYDSPCQLKLTSMEGLDRGATKVPMYNAFRSEPAELTRLHVDAKDTEAWRKKGFYPVLNELHQSPQENLTNSVLYRLLKLKQENPLPNQRYLPESITTGADRDPQCPGLVEMNDFEKSYPLWGMPYGFPALNEAELSTLRAWLSEGALITKAPETPKKIQTQVKVWENFLNGSSLKEKLMSRFLYEHLFLAELYFEDADHSLTFKLVRSTTPPGEEIKIIPTRRPYDDPESENFYYRLRPLIDDVVSKTTMPYSLSKSRLKRFTELFLTPDYEVKELPSYDTDVASNPFIAFQAIPAKNRYQFLLDEAQFMVMAFIKGPVCRGQTAVNSIDDQFWVFFVDPDKDPFIQSGEFLHKNGQLLKLPAQSGSDASIIWEWEKYEDDYNEFLENRRKFAREQLKSLTAINLDFIWDGEQKNQNAALTVFRNYDNAVVLKGLVGDTPKTAWVIDYDLMERLYYLLVAGFDVYGNLGHQTMTRLYMDFLRMEGENNFLAFLPINTRKREHDFWYRGFGARNVDDTWDERNQNWGDSGITYTTADPKKEFFGLIRSRLGSAVATGFDIPKNAPAGITTMSHLKGLPVSHLSEASYVRVKTKSGNDQIYSLVLNRAHSNVAMILMENFRLLPAEDTLSVAPGFIGDYPNALFEVDEARLPEFAGQISKLTSDKDYERLRDKFGIRRTNPNFWALSDWFQDQFQKQSVIGTTIVDFGNMDNR